MKRDVSIAGAASMAMGFALLVFAVAVLFGCANKPPPMPSGPALEKVNSQPAETATVAVGRGKSLWDADKPFSRVVSVTFAPILFPLDGDHPIDDEVIGLILEEAPKYKVCRIEGHACPIGSDEYNQALGYRRAQSVAARLALSGVRLVLVSHGESQPAEDYPSSRRSIVECDK